MTNQAAWIKEKLAAPLEVGDAPLPRPGDDAVLLRVSHAAVNPVDWKIQREAWYADFVSSYPNILGCDVAGEVVETGKDVKHVRRGDRVLCHLDSLHTSDPAKAAFQRYTVANLPAIMKIPDTMSFAEACVLPLGFSTAAYGLYAKDLLNLSLPIARPTPSQQVLLLWGGSSSVGFNVIQLAKASGLRVAATCSPANSEAVKAAGADWVFDHRESEVVVKIQQQLGELDLVGAYDAIGDASTVIACAQVLSRIHSPSNKKLVATVLPPPDTKDLPDGVLAKTFAAFQLISKDGDRELAKALWQDFLPEALQAGQYKALPEPLVIGRGLESVQEALDTLRKGVSAKKVVVNIGGEAI